MDREPKENRVRKRGCFFYENAIIPGKRGPPLRPALLKIKPEPTTYIYIYTHVYREKEREKIT